MEQSTRTIQLFTLGLLSECECAAEPTSNLDVPAKKRRFASFSSDMGTGFNELWHMRIGVATLHSNHLKQNVATSFSLSNQ